MENAGKNLIGTGIYKVIVTDDAVPVPGATVSIYSADFSVWSSAVTNRSGVAHLRPGNVDHKILYLKTMKPDCRIDTNALMARSRRP